MELYTLMRYNNPWWDDRRDPLLSEDLVDREAFGTLVEGLEQVGVQIITGIRRSGKSILLHQLVQHVSSLGIPPRNILLFQFEESLHRFRLEEVIQQYFKRVLMGTPDEANGHVYIFLDEIQYQPDWQAEVKRYHDLFKGHLRFVVSGSHSRMIRRMAGESLAGRVREQRIELLSFDEYLSFYGERAPRIDLEALVRDRGGREHSLRQIAFELDGRAGELSERYDAYMRSGQFPEVARSEPEVAYEYINQRVIERVLRMDLLDAFAEEIRKPRALIDLYRVLASESGGVLEIDTLSREVGLSKPTLIKYLDIMKDGYLVRLIPNLQRSARKSFRSAHKAYVGSASILAAHQRYDPGLYAEPLMRGALFECAVLDWLSARHRARNRYDTRDDPISMWRERRQEVDFVIPVDQGRRVVPLEVKSGARLRGSDLQVLRGFMHRFDVDLGIVVTPDRFDVHETDEGDILVLPVWVLG